VANYFILDATGLVVNVVYCEPSLYPIDPAWIPESATPDGVGVGWRTPDGGTTYTRTLYQFPRITAVLSTPLYSPPIVISGSKVEVVQTIAGTTPSFTRAIYMNQVQYPPKTTTRQIFDRTIVLTTLSSTTANLYSETTGSNVVMDVSTAGTWTTSPVVQLQASDDNGANWFSIGAPLTITTGSPIQTTSVITNQSWQLYRAQATTAGVNGTLNYIKLRSF